MDLDERLRVSKPQIWVAWVIYADLLKIGWVCLWTILWKNKFMNFDFFSPNLLSDIQWALPKYRTPQVNSFFELIDVRFLVEKPQKSIIEDVVVGVSSKLGILEALWPQIFFPSQSTIVREDVYQKSAMWLHLDSRDTALKILKNPLTFYTRVVVSPLIRVSH